MEVVPQKTAQLYAQLNDSHFTSGQYTQRLVDNLNEGARIGDSLLYNVFERVAFNFFPGLDTYKDRFMKSGAGSFHLAGAGPTLYTLVPDEAKGKSILNKLKADDIEVYFVHTMNVQLS